MMGEPATVGRIVHVVLDGTCVAAIVTAETATPADSAVLHPFPPATVTPPPNPSQEYRFAGIRGTAPAEDTWHWPREH
jgi:hypothetical protein